MSEEEKLAYDKVKTDTEIIKVLPFLASKRVLVYQKTARNRFAKMRPLLQCCKQVLDADSYESIVNLITSFNDTKGGGSNSNSNNSNNNNNNHNHNHNHNNPNDQKIDLLIIELDRDVAPRICDFVRSRSLSKKFASSPLIPIFLTTANDGEGDQAHGEVLRRCLKEGACGYLQEPVHMGQLILTTGLILKQYETIHKVYASIAREGPGLGDAKAYPKVSE